MDFGEFCSRLLENTDIVKLISRYCTLRRMGSSFKACCPFHAERTPSFTVDPVKQLYHCFGCGKGGNAITFLRDIENIESIDAIRMLADEANMELPAFEGRSAPKVDKQQRQRLFELMREAARHYHDNLRLASAAPANEYLRKRMLPENIVTRFGLGYSVNYDDIVVHLESKGYTKQEMKEVGLVGQKGDRYYDLFHGRLIYPIISNIGQVVGFGGRVLEKSADQAKYRNTSQTVLFDKSRTVYALNLLKKKRQAGPLDSVIMCEGYMDVIALHKAGFDNAVASMGTALTHQQAKQIKNYSDKVYISYDGDGAGQKATLRGLDILRECGLTVKVVQLPEGQDPDEVVNGEGGADAYRKLLAEALPLTEFKLRKLRAKYRLDDRDDRTKYAAEAVRCVRQLENPVEVEEYLRTIAEETGYDMGVLRKQADLSAPEKEEISEAKEQEQTRGDTLDKTEMYLLAAYVNGKEYVNPADMTEIFTDGFGKAVVDSVTDSRLRGLKDASAMLYSDLPETFQKEIPPVIDFDFGGWDDRNTYGACVSKLKCDRWEKEREELAKKFDESKDMSLLARINEVNKLLQTLRKNGGK